LQFQRAAKQVERNLAILLQVTVTYMANVGILVLNAESCWRIVLNFPMQCLKQRLPLMLLEEAPRVDREGMKFFVLTLLCYV
jgi:hypothetical protein